MPRDFQISRDNPSSIHHAKHYASIGGLQKKDQLNFVLTSAIDEARRSANLLLFAYVL